jgi:hypothetical protein
MTVFVTFKESGEASRAVERLDGNTLQGRRLSAGLDWDCGAGSGEKGVGGGNGNGKGGARIRGVTAPKGVEVGGRYGGEKNDEGDEGGNGKQVEGVKRTRGPLVVDGARWSGRRRHDVEREDKSGDDESDSEGDASDEEREKRRTDSSEEGGGMFSLFAPSCLVL